MGIASHCKHLGFYSKGNESHCKIFSRGGLNVGFIKIVLAILH